MMKLTIFTPAYNRAETLPRLYESLLRQTCRDFEWLIIDDGSTDNTPELAANFKAPFPVRYVRKENGGKHTAHNLALTEAAGDWFLCVDSDDLLADTAVEDLLALARTLEPDTGIAAYKSDLDGRLLCGAFPEGLERTRLFDLPEVYGCGGEFTLVFPLALARRFPFPVFAGERFVTESVIYDRMDAVARFAPLPRVITVCEYQADGYSSGTDGLMRRNPNGYCLYFLQRIDLQRTWRKRLVCAGKYWCFRYISGNKELVYRGEHRLTAALGAVLGLVFRAYYKFVRKI